VTRLELSLLQKVHFFQGETCHPALASERSLLSYCTFEAHLPRAERFGRLVDRNISTPRSFDSLSIAWSWKMCASPSIVPGADRDVYLVLDDFGRMGCAWREANVEDTTLETVIDDLLEGQYSNPVRVIVFNVSEGWVRDVSEEIAEKLRRRCADENRELPYSLHQLVEQAASA
jgi:hypothetical protein